MTKTKSIGAVIFKQAMPIIVSIAAASSFILITGILLIVSRDNKSLHDEKIQQFKNIYTSIVDQELSKFEPITHSKLVTQFFTQETEQSKQALDNFLASINNRIPYISSLNIYDNNGHRLSTSKQNSPAQASELTTAMLSSQKQIYIDATGFYFVIPIIHIGKPAGILIGEISSLEQLLPIDFHHSVIVIVDSHKKILFSTMAETFIPNTIFDKSTFNHWRVPAKQALGNSTILSLEKTFIFYEEISKLLVFLLLAIAFIFISGLICAHAAGKIASKITAAFIDSIKQHHKSQNATELDTETFNAIELQSLKTEFQKLIQHLVTSNLSKDRVSALINSLNDLLIVFDLDGNQIISNKAFTDFFNNSLSKDRSLLNYLFPDLDASTLLNTEASLFELEIQYTNKPNQHPSTIMWKKNSLIDDRGKTIGVIFVGLDTTKSKELATYNHLMQIAISDADTGIAIIESFRGSTLIRYANTSFIRLSGFKKDKMVDRAIKLDDFPSIAKDSQKIIKTAVIRGRSATEIIKVRLPSGERRHIEVILSPIKIPNRDSLKYSMAILKDVTDAQLTSKLLLDAKQKAEESTKMKSTFLARMSHEIRTPLYGVTGMLDILRDSNLNQQQINWISVTQHSANVLLSLINDILDFSKIEAGKLSIKHSNFNLLEMIDNFIDTMSPLANNKGLELIIDTADLDNYCVLGDAARLQQILTNLVNNSIKFTNSGEVLVRLQLKETSELFSTLTVSVKDTGSGFPEKDQEFLFDAFTQSNANQDTAVNGTGLGLAIVKQLCSAMNGDVKIVKSNANGSVFQFNVQLGRCDQKIELSSHSEIFNKKILIVDDNTSSLNSLSRQLSKWGADVTNCDNAENCLTIISKNIENFDAIIIDADMPKMTGEALGSKINALSKGNKLKLILMTPIDHPEDIEHLSNIGFAGSFSKPAKATELFETLAGIFKLDDNSQLLISKPPQILPTPSAFKAGTKILLVEDNPINQLIAKSMLESAGISITVAQNGEAAINKLKEKTTQYDLILMDCQMPVLNGFEATKLIRIGSAGASNMELPIIAMTANAMKGDREQCIKVGMNDYISKPFSKDSFLKLLKNWLPLEAEE